MLRWVCTQFSPVVSAAAETNSTSTSSSRQSDEFRAAGGLTAYYRFMATLGRSHPFPVIRVAELRNWVDSGSYNEILKGDYRLRSDPRPVRADMTEAGKNFSTSAARVFEDTDRYVNDALTSFATNARKFFDDSM